jgi:hypothetical protein
VDAQNTRWKGQKEEDRILKDVPHLDVALK